MEIKVGQGAKPGIGGHLPGEKADRDIASTRMIPQGSDAISPAPHHDIYSIEDLRQLIYSIKEATGYKPVGVKIAAVHNVAAIASGIVRAGADYVYLDGFRGGTGAAPQIIRDHVGIPLEIAVAVVDQRLRDEGIRQRASIIAAGSIRSSADLAKAIALGADAVAIGSASLIALGCHLCQGCHTGNCSWGLTTHKPELTRRLDPEWGAERLTNLINAWSHELQEILGALGVNAIESLARQPRTPAQHRPGRADVRDHRRQAGRTVKGDDDMSPAIAAEPRAIGRTTDVRRPIGHTSDARPSATPPRRRPSRSPATWPPSTAAACTTARSTKRCAPPWRAAPPTVRLLNVNGQRYIGTGLRGESCASR